MINVKQWMDLPVKVRAKIIKDFKLERTGKAGVANNRIVSDGYTQGDILKINLLNLQIVLDSADENFDTMFADYVDMIQKTLAVIEEPKEITIEVDMNTFKPLDTPEFEVPYNPLVAASGDTETYFGTKIKPITYIQNGKKTTKRN